jgi:hypothetical protein
MAVGRESHSEWTFARNGNGFDQMFDIVEGDEGDLIAVGEADGEEWSASQRESGMGMRFAGVM